MITKKDALFIKDVLAQSMARCSTSEMRQGVMWVDSMFIKAWDDGLLGFDESLTISEYAADAQKYIIKD